VRTSSGFNAHMNQRSVGAQRSRLQELRRQHGWSWFRSKNSAGGRAYRDDLQAKKWRFLGGAARPEEGGTIRNSKLAGKYRLGKEALQAGAGWKRFIPFTSARRNYKIALNQFRTGDLGNDSALTPFDRLMNSKSANRVINRDRDLEQERNPRKKQFNADQEELAEIQGLLGSGPEAGGPGMIDPANGGAGSDASAQQPDASNGDAQKQGLDDSFDEEAFQARIGVTDEEQSEGADDEPNQFNQFMFMRDQTQLHQQPPEMKHDDEQSEDGEGDPLDHQKWLLKQHQKFQ
jgi:hypothetical protein